MTICELCGEPMPEGEAMFKFHGYSGPCPKPRLPMDTQPRVTDDDKGDVTVTFNGGELRGWSYANDAERRVKMTAAREYVEGWCDGREAVTSALGSAIASPSTAVAGRSACNSSKSTL